MGTTSQFQAREFFHPHNLPPPPPTVPPPPVPTNQNSEPIYAYPSSLYGTLPRGPPRPVKRPNLPLFEEPLGLVDFVDTDEDHQKSLTGSLINYATFRQNISNDAAIAAQKRAMITAKIAKHWSNDDLTNLQNLPTMPLRPPSASESDADSSDFSSVEAAEIRMASPSPPGARSRSSSPGKTVTFLEQDERSLNELESSPRRVIDLRPITSAASSLFGGHKKAKRLAPSPPLSKDEKEEEVLEDNMSHEALGARLSASLRATFARNQSIC